MHDDDIPLTGSANATVTMAAETESDVAVVDTDLPISKAAPLSIDDQPLSGQSSSNSNGNTASTAMTDAFPSADPAEQPPAAAAATDATSNSDSSPLCERLVSKDWKVRKPAFEELVQVFQTATSKSVFAEYGKCYILCSCSAQFHVVCHATQMIHTCIALSHYLNR